MDTSKSNIILSIQIAIQNPEDKNVYIATRNYNYNEVGILHRAKLKEMSKFFVRESLPLLEKGSRQACLHENTYIYIQVAKTQLISAFALCKIEYKPQRIIYQFLNKCLDAFFCSQGDKWAQVKKDNAVEVPAIKQLLQEYNNPTNVDKVTEAQMIVDQTKDILCENIWKLLQRVGDLDFLITKSKDLSQQSKQLYKKSAEMNRPLNCTCNIY